MIELKYVQKRKRKRRVAIVSAAAAMGLTVLGIVAFLGRFVGTFTVTMNTGTVQLSLATKEDFSDQTSFLRVDSLKPFHESSYDNIQMDAYQKSVEVRKSLGEDIPDGEDVNAVADALIDSTYYDYLMGADYDADGYTVQSMSYFKYTFYIKNTGSITADYDFTVNIQGNIKATDDSDRYLLDTLRVRIFENFADDGNHSSSVYALTKDTAHDDYAFKSTEEVGTLQRTKRFESGDVKRYTIVTWLDGDDPDSSNGAPIGASVKLGIQVNAYESENEEN